jgi:hypothetical protein
VSDNDEMREFMLVIYRALGMIRAYLSKKYGFGS